MRTAALLAIMLGACLPPQVAARPRYADIQTRRTIPTVWCYSLVTPRGHVPTSDYCFPTKPACVTRSESDREEMWRRTHVTPCTAVEL